MKADTLLDYAAFQLYPGQTRCELVLSGGGETENLDPVLLEALIAHLPAAKELTNEAVHVLKLELHEDENVAQWFTKLGWSCARLGASLTILKESSIPDFIVFIFHSVICDSHGGGFKRESGSGKKIMEYGKSGISYAEKRSRVEEENGVGHAYDDEKRNSAGEISGELDVQPSQWEEPSL